MRIKKLNSAGLLFATTVRPVGSGGRRSLTLHERETAKWPPVLIYVSHLQISTKSFFICVLWGRTTRCFGGAQIDRLSFEDWFEFGQDSSRV
ncbi:hypothetical protein L1987_24342 [Smallanthus sonchifolius]|uniref:Uncharacterized protein n=1 Tax=Smallanthus sonchifolius TaxID=185202 RepID=A0ACB9IMU1_9ASTR|nr:hypothetical protein L1987_24342 [Smallanthus sonchifolius]